MNTLKSEIRRIIKEEMSTPRVTIKNKVGTGKLLNEVVSKTFKIPTQRGTLHIEFEEDNAGIILDVIYDKADLATIDILWPTGDVTIRQKQKRVKFK